MYSWIRNQLSQHSLSKRKTPIRPALLSLEERIVPATLGDIQFWVGSGSNEAGFVADWNNGETVESIIWGYRWDGTATGEDMLRAIAGANVGFFAHLGVFGFGNAVYGIGFDADQDGVFGVNPTLDFINGIAETPSTTQLNGSRMATDPGDYYEENFFDPGFWAYWNSTGSTNNWTSSPVGITDRILNDGDFDGLSFTTVPFPGEEPSEPVPFSQPTFDFGDAPQSYGVAQHSVSGPILGFEIDEETVNNFSDDALGDDISQSPDDEDGVTFPSTLLIGESNEISVHIGGIAGNHARLYGWIDFDGNGTFESGEQIADGTSLLSYGDHTVSFSVPADAVPGNTFARFRVSTEAGLAATGSAIDGEVEDYQVALSASKFASITPEGNLVINGSPKRDFIRVDAENLADVKVFFRNRPFTEGSPFDLTSGGRVIIHGGDSRDVINVNGNVDFEIYGGAEDDRIDAKGGGTKVIHGGAGNDRIDVDGGNSVLIGGLGKDRLAGDFGKEIFVGGTTARTYQQLLGDLQLWVDSDTISPALVSTIEDPDDRSNVDRVITGGNADLKLLRLSRDRHNLDAEDTELDVT